MTNFKKARISANLTQQQAAFMLDCSISQIQKLDQGLTDISRVSVNFAVKCAKLFKCEVSDLYGNH